MSQLIKVLHIEDTTSEARTVQQLLNRSKEIQFQIERASELREGLMFLAEKKYDVVITDLQLPDGYGLDTFRLVQDHALHLPIILLTNLEDETLGRRAIAAGAQDYLLKTKIDSERLIHVILFSIERHRLVSELRERYEATIAELEKKLASS